MAPFSILKSQTAAATAAASTTSVGLVDDDRLSQIRAGYRRRDRFVTRSAVRTFAWGLAPAVVTVLARLFVDPRQALAPTLERLGSTTPESAAQFIWEIWVVAVVCWFLWLSTTTAMRAASWSMSRRDRLQFQVSEMRLELDTLHAEMGSLTGSPRAAARRS